MPGSISTKENLLIIAGEGELPVIASQKAHLKGYKLFISPLSSFFFFQRNRYKYHGLIKNSFLSLRKYLAEIKQKSISQVLLVGKFEKLYFFANFHKLDRLAREYLKKSTNCQDNSLHEQVERIFNEAQIKVLSQKDFLSDLLAQKKDYNPEILLKKDLQEDLSYGIQISKKSAALEIGQTIVVKNKSVIALEAIEGTNSAIKRGCKLIKNALVVKAPWSEQSTKFDLPTVGPETIKIMSRYKASLLAVKAGITFIIQPKKTLQIANKHKIKLIGF